MKFQLEIEIGNDTMQTRGDVARALRHLGTLITGVSSEEPFSPQHVGLGFPIKDTNGNTVGSWRVVEDHGHLTPERLLADGTRADAERRAQG